MIIISFNATRCAGCYACVVACQDQNERFENDPPLRQLCQIEGNGLPGQLSFLSIACFHCGDAPCLMACPTGAIFRHGKTGIVDITRDLCVECHSCELACPFGAPQFAADGKMVKCHLCASRLAHGLDPACVHTCPTQALFVDETSAFSCAKAQEAGMRILRAAIHPAEAR